MLKMKTKKLIITGLLLALGVLLARVLHMLPLPLPAKMFSPLHLPIFICAVVCGMKYGVACGLILPFLSFLISAMPPIYPAAVAMSIELMAYAVVTAAVLRVNWIKANIAVKTFVAVLIAQIIGRAAGGLATAILLSFGGRPYLFATFVTAYFAETLPAIIIQLIIVPPIAKIAKAYKLIS